MITQKPFVSASRGLWSSRADAVAQPVLGIALVMLAAALWGTVGVATQLVTASRFLSDTVFGIARMLLGGPAILLVVVLAKRGVLSSVLMLDPVKLMAFVTACAVFQVSLFRSFALLGVTSAVFLTVCLPPVLGCGWALIRRTQPVSRGAAGALGLAVAGIGTFAWSRFSADTLEQITVGLAFAILASVAFVVMTSAARDLTQACGPMIVVGVGLTLSGALLVVALPVIETQALQVSALADWQVLGLLLYLGLAPTALAYLAYCSGTARCRSANVGLIATMLEPAIAAVLAWLLLHEKLLPGEWAGCFMVSVAMLLLWWSEQRKRNMLSD